MAAIGETIANKRAGVVNVYTGTLVLQEATSSSAQFDPANASYTPKTTNQLLFPITNWNVSGSSQWLWQQTFAFSQIPVDYYNFACCMNYEINTTSTFQFALAVIDSNNHSHTIVNQTITTPLLQNCNTAYIQIKNLYIPCATSSLFITVTFPSRATNYIIRGLWTMATVQDQKDVTTTINSGAF